MQGAQGPPGEDGATGVRVRLRDL